MSGGQKINDHSFWAGGRGKSGSVLPDGGAKTKMESSAEGDGDLAKYGDTTEAIKAQQVAGVGKAKSHAMKSGYRN